MASSTLRELDFGTGNGLDLSEGFWGGIQADLEGVPITTEFGTEALSVVFGPYRRSVVMQSRPLHGDRKSLPERRFRLSAPWKDGP
jgi:hypothetical protein